MQNRGALWIFTILLGLACLWQLSFTVATNSFERAAAPAIKELTDSAMADPQNAKSDTATVYLAQETKYFRDHADDQAYPLLGYSYRECKDREMNLGLDLKGGMAVTLEVSIPELVDEISGNSDNGQFVKAMANARASMANSDKDFITLFRDEWNKLGADSKMAAVFHTQENEKKFDREATNDQVIAVLRKEAETAILNTEKIMRTRIDKFGVSQPSIQKQQFSGRIQIELPGVKDKERVRKVLQSTANLEFWECYDNQEFGNQLAAANKPLSALLHPELATADSLKKDSASTAAADSLTKTNEETASADSLGTDSGKVDTATADTQETPVDTAAEQEKYRKENPLYSMAGPLVPNVDERGGFRKGPDVAYCAISDTAEANRLLAMPAVRNALPSNVKLLWGAKPTIPGGKALALYALKIPNGTGGKPKLDGSVIIDARQDFDLKGDVEVRMQMDAQGGQLWKRMTAENVGKCVAVVLDELVYTAPNIHEEIPNGNSSITLGRGRNMDDQVREADDLANILKAGALPAPARIIDETVVGASLGKDNIQAGLVSFVIALIAVLLYMLMYYAGAGWVANIALFANVFILIGSLASLQATLTLPGIAGIVLTMGMAVDANVLIYERIREELRHGKMLKSAVDLGYKHALSAIIDSNITTFATGLILFLFGSGPIKGFATTLMIGILTSLFTAIFLSRLIISRRLEKGKNVSLWYNWSKNILVGVNVDWMSRRKVFYAISTVLIGVGIFSMFTRGFSEGVEFSGGRMYVVQFNNAVGTEDVRSALAPVLVEESGTSSVVVKTFGGDRTVKVTTNFMVQQNGAVADSTVEAKVNEGLSAVGTAYDIKESRKVDPTISDDIRSGAFWSVGLALVFMFIYIWLRFDNWQFGLGALLSLAHDALFVLGLYSLLHGIVPFGLEVDEAFIAAILTVIGYSVNDTVVVFDRIREYLREHKRDSTISVFNRAINSTLGRTLNTSATTLVTLLVMFLLGGDSIRGFLFGLFMGILVGTYSSIFIASAVTVDLLKRKRNVPESAVVA